MEEEKVISNDEEINFEDEPEETPTSEPKEKSEEEVSNKEPSVQKQSSKVNREEKQKRLLHENYIKGKIDAIGVNPYTGKPIKTEADLRIYEKMKTAKEQGDENAIASGYQSYIDEVNQKETSEKEAQETMSRQMESFRKAVPDYDTRRKILNDSHFKKIYGKIIENGGDLGEAAVSFMEISGMNKNPSYEQGKKLATQAPLPQGQGTPTKVDYSKMSEKDIHEAFLKTKFGS